MSRSRVKSALAAIHVPLALIVLLWAAGGVASLGPNSLDRYVTVSAVNLVFAIGIYVYMGTTGVVSFGHFGFATLGAYVGGLLSMSPELKSATLPDLPQFIAARQLEPLFAVVVAGCAAALVAVALAPAIGRISGLAASLATLSLLFVARSVAANLTSYTRGTAGLSSVPRWTTLTNSLVVASIFIVLV
jgi:branched-chain amino acid transport system permease protein